MPNKSLLSTVIGLYVVWPNLILLLSAGSAQAQTSPENYVFLVASGFLCDPGDSGNCPAVAKSANGDTYEISGAGTFEPPSKFVKAAGTFNHKSANGNTLQTGVWTANELVSFVSYGIAPGALLHEKRILGPPPFAPKRLVMFSGAMPTGGLAIFRILLMPMSGSTAKAVLQVNCALGHDVPRERSVEGIRLTLERNGGEFSEEVTGRVMFLSVHPVVSAPAKTPRQETAPDLPEQPSN
jgi:hypothetical protein